MPAAAARPTASVEVSTSFSDEIEDDHTLQMPIGDEKTRALEVDPEEAHIREVYAEYGITEHQPEE